MEIGPNNCRKTKINRCLAEGRERFRRVFASSEDGSRCAEMRFLLSAFCDGEASAAQSAEMREHLRACGRCRATVRAYRSVPAKVAALSPLPVALSAGGTKGGGLGGLATKLAGAKQLVGLCAAAGTAACVATGAVPLPDRLPERPVEPRIERSGELQPGSPPDASADSHRHERDENGRKRRNEKRRRKRTEPTAKAAATEPTAVPAPAPQPVEAAPAPVEGEPTSSSVEPVEAEPAPSVASEPAPTTPAPETGGAAGEFGP
ncbi:MAG TPA: zf-HC2 domain-containing protein [Solirubrobacterales bacterium]|jgi:hypothetical protein